jgi:hypothetical protein
MTNASLDPGVGTKSERGTPRLLGQPFCPGGDAGISHEAIRALS